ncbi:MAG: VWA domain-containing protein [Acidobacteriota bacterium]
MKRLGALLLVLGGLCATVSSAQVGGRPEVEITSPSAQQPAFGLVEIRADVSSSTPISQVECFVDGRSLGVRRDLPFRWITDVGNDNEERIIEIEVETIVGAKARAELRTPRIEVDEVLEVDLLQVYALVEKNGERRTDLPRSAFRIVDDHGHDQDVVSFESGDLPLSAALLVDSSASMGGPRLEAALAGVHAFASGLREEDEAMVALFSDQILRLTPFTNDAVALEDQLLGVQAVGTTALNDHLYYALGRLDEQLGRRVVVLLSDGDDITSVLPMEDVLWRARRSQALLYWIRLDEGAVEGAAPKPRRFTSTWRSADDNASELEALRSAVEESGGREIVVSKLEDLEGSFADVLAELRDQVLLGFHPSDRRHDGSWRPFRVKVQGGYRVRARAGFVDD